MNRPALRAMRKQLRVIEREVERQLKSQTLCCGVTPAQCHALLELAEAVECSLGELSERLRLDSSTLSRTVDGLVRAGYVDRINDPDNRRYVRLELTEAGRRKVEFIDRAADRFYLEALSRVPKGKQADLAESARLLAEIFVRMREPEGRGAQAAAPRKNGGRRDGRR